MLQSIQYIGSGPPTYVYSNKAGGASNEFYHVFATETRGYREGRKHAGTGWPKKELKTDAIEQEELKVLNNSQSEGLQEIYQKEYGRRESFLWKQK